MLGLMFILKKKKRELLGFPCISMTNSFQHILNWDPTSSLLKAWDRNRMYAVSKVNTSPHPDWLCINSLPSRIYIDSKRLVYFFGANKSKARTRMNTA